MHRGIADHIVHQRGGVLIETVVTGAVLLGNDGVDDVFSVVKRHGQIDHVLFVPDEVDVASFVLSIQGAADVVRLHRDSALANLVPFVGDAVSGSHAVSIVKGALFQHAVVVDADDVVFRKHPKARNRFARFLLRVVFIGIAAILVGLNVQVSAGQVHADEALLAQQRFGDLRARRNGKRAVLALELPVGKAAAAAARLLQVLAPVLHRIGRFVLLVIQGDDVLCILADYERFRVGEDESVALDLDDFILRIDARAYLSARHLRFVQHLVRALFQIAHFIAIVIGKRGGDLHVLGDDAQRALQRSETGHLLPVFRLPAGKIAQHMLEERAVEDIRRDVAFAQARGVRHEGGVDHAAVVVEELHLPIGIAADDHAVYMVAVALPFDDVPANRLVAGHGLVRQARDLLRRGRFDDVFGHIVIDIVGAGDDATETGVWGLNPICTNQARSDRIIQLRLFIAVRVAMANEELRVRGVILGRLLVRIHFDDVDIVWIPITTHIFTRRGDGDFLVERVLHTVDPPAAQPGVLGIERILVVTGDERRPIVAVSSGDDALDLLFYILASAVRPGKVVIIIAHMDRLRLRAVVVLLPLRLQRQVGVHLNLGADIVGFAVAAQISGEIIVDGRKEVAANRGDSSGLEGVGHRGIDGCGHRAARAVLVDIAHRVRGVVGLVRQAVFQVGHANHGHADDLVAIGGIGACNGGRAGAYARDEAVFVNGGDVRGLRRPFALCRIGRGGCAAGFQFRDKLLLGVHGDDRRARVQHQARYAAGGAQRKAFACVHLLRERVYRQTGEAHQRHQQISHQPAHFSFHGCYSPFHLPSQPASGRNVSSLLFIQPSASFPQRSGQPARQLPQRPAPSGARRFPRSCR